MKNLVLSVLFPLLVVTFLIADESLEYGVYVVPILACGILTFNQAINRISKASNLLVDANFLVWATLFLGSFVAPLIHFVTNEWMKFVDTSMLHWEEWSIVVSTLYLIGFVFLWITLNKRGQRSATLVTARWEADQNRVRWIYFLMAISFIAQTYFYYSVGGISGYVGLFEDKEAGLKGMGAFFVLSELFPMLLILAYFIRNSNKEVSAISVYLFLGALFLSALYFGGLRGSRSNTILTVFQGVVLVHYSIRRFSSMNFIILVLAGLVFMFVGKIYKTWGSEIVNMSFSEMTSSNRHTSSSGIITGDLARYDVHCFMIYRLETSDTYNLKGGRTYFDDVLSFIPQQWRPEGLVTKTVAGSELLYNVAEFKVERDFRASRIYGFVGQWMLNFGWVTSPLAYVLLGVVVNYFRRVIEAIPSDDLRFFLATLIVIYVIFFINQDIDNIMFLTIKRLIPLYLVLLFVSKKKLRQGKVQTVGK